MEDFFFKVLEIIITIAFTAGSPYLTAKSKEGQDSLRGMRFRFLYNLICGVVILVVALTVDIEPWVRAFQIGCAIVCFATAIKEFFRTSAASVRLIEVLSELATNESTDKSSGEVK